MIYENVKQACSTKGESIAALEARVGLANGTIGGWRTKAPKIYSLMKVAKGLDVPIEELIAGVEVELIPRSERQKSKGMKGDSGD